MADAAASDVPPVSRVQNSQHINILPQSLDGTRHQSRPQEQATSNAHGNTQTRTHAQHRRGRGRGRSQVANNRPAASTPARAPATNSYDNVTPATGRTVAQGSNQRSSQRGRSNGTRTPHSTVVHGRQFGGTLTVREPESATNMSKSSTPLHPQAPDFIPSQPAIEGPVAKTRRHQPRKRRASKSVASDLPTRIHEDIDNRQYECAICTSEILRNSAIWSCHNCWTVFHLDCVKKWSENSDAASTQQLEDGQNAAPKLWRCPGCNLPQEIKPRYYQCWCEKELDPKSISGIPPHSCGQTCGRQRLPKDCPHPCELLCHAGPCPPCNHLGPKQLCFCGKESTTRRCIETDYNAGGWSCNQVCGDLMPCGEHMCPRTCHPGLCGACEVRLEARCYCGKEEKALLCCDKDDEKLSALSYHSSDRGATIVEEWKGLFSCTNPCSRLFDCKLHECLRECHAQDELPARCPYSPELVTHCPCGETPLNQLLSLPRSSCKDQIPNCGRKCFKMLPCGHECQQACHAEDCMPCMEEVMIRCRCGRTSETIICSQAQQDPPQCGRICHVALNCGRHECGQVCCNGEKKAAERQSTKRKNRPLNSTRPTEEEFEAEHICTRICGRLLKCGNHNCPELCHKGQCRSCREAIFDDISCHCGRTVLQAPLPCGTKPPPCRFECERIKDCGHPQVSHNCHDNDQPCPKCPFLVEKVCLCEKKTLKNQQCSSTNPTCGQVCMRRLRCGSHFCRKTCHKPGECEDIGATCSQACGKLKATCGHPCDDTCHAPYPCREEKPCTHKIIVTCECQNKKQETRCNACKSNFGNTVKSLKCDDECARLERNRKLALALNIDTETHKDDHVPYAEETLRLFLDNTKWAQEQEREFRVFATSASEKRIRFKPMPSQQRAFLHALAEDFGFDSESMDPEPHRHVAIFKTPRFVSAPSKTLRDCVRIRQSQATEHAKSKAVPAAQSSVAKDLYNGFLLTSARFALTLDELHSEIAVVQGPAPKLLFDIQFLPSSDSVALKARAPLEAQKVTELNIHTLLQAVKVPLTRSLINTHGLGSNLYLARFDESLAVLRREDDAEGFGWSKVAAKAAAHSRPAPVQQNLEKNAFTVLSTLNSAKKRQEKEAADAATKERKHKQREQEVVPDDWELIEDVEEEKDKDKEEDKEGETLSAPSEAATTAHGTS